MTFLASCPANRYWPLSDTNANRPDRNLFLETALHTYTQTNPREAALWLANQPPSSETERLMNQVMAAWTAFEPQETARWAGELPNPALRAKSITSVAESWAKVDPDGLVAWLDGLSDPNMRDAAVEGAIRVWMRNDPATAAQWVTGIVDRGRRDHNISLVVREWKNHDLAAAMGNRCTSPCRKRKASLAVSVARPSSAASMAGDRSMWSSPRGGLKQTEQYYAPRMSSKNLSYPLNGAP